MILLEVVLFLFLSFVIIAIGSMDVAAASSIRGGGGGISSKDDQFGERLCELVKVISSNICIFIAHKDYASKCVSS